MSGEVGMAVVRVTDETTRAELAATIALLCEDAKALSRRGKAWDGDPEWARLHEILGAVLEDWERAPA